MDQRDEFSKWMGTVEEALTKESTGELDIIMLPQAQEQCGCGSWDCPVCFPDMDEPEIEFQSPVAATAGDEVCQSCGSPVNGHVHDDMAGMTDMTFPNQEIDELSKDTLASYIPKAARSASDLASRAAFALGGADENDPDWSDAGEEDDMKAYRRLAGIDTATRKLTSEEPMDFEQKPKMERSADGHIKLGDIVQTTEFRKTGGQNSPMTYGDDNLDEGNWYNPEMDDLAVDSQWSDSDVGFGDQQEEVEKSEIIKKILYLQDLGVGKSSQNYTEQQLMSMNIDQLRQIEGNSTGEVSEDDMAPDMGAAPNMGSASGGGGYAPGTAPTMPESIQQGQHTMEDVDKDVAAMLTSLRKYDRLKESVAPVLGMRMISEKKPDFPDLDKDGNETETMAKALKDKAAKVDEDSHLAGDKKSKWSDDPKDHFKGAVAKVVGKVKKESKEGESDSEGGELDESEDKNSWEKLASDDKKDKEEAETKTHMGGTVTKTKTGLVHKKADESVEVNEEADPEVLTWMKRFANLGNMKGYGR